MLENRQARGGPGKRSERHRLRWTDAVPLCKGPEARQGTWIEYAVERGDKRTCTNSFFTSLAVTANNVERTARGGQARWKIENEGFNCLARHGCNFGHGKAALSNVLAALNLFAFALHAVLQCVCALWRQCRRKLVTRRGLFRQLQAALQWFCFPDWPTLLAAVRDARVPAGRGLASAQLRAGSVRRAVDRGGRLPPGCVLSRARHQADPSRGRDTALLAIRRSLGAASIATTSRSTCSLHPPQQRSPTTLMAKFRTAGPTATGWRSWRVSDWCGRARRTRCGA